MENEKMSGVNVSLRLLSLNTRQISKHDPKVMGDSKPYFYVMMKSLRDIFNLR
jgi:hypothetical protein